MHANILAELTDIFREVFADPGLTLTPATTARDIDGWDSFRQIEIAMAAEAWFGIRFGTRELEGLSHVGDLMRVIAARLSPQQDVAGLVHP